jgi:hypothetical protein
MRNPYFKEKSVSEEKTKEIATLNDRFRLRFNIPFGADEPIVPGQIVSTRAVLDLSPELQVNIWERVRRFDAFFKDECAGRSYRHLSLANSR